MRAEVHGKQLRLSGCDLKPRSGAFDYLARPVGRQQVLSAARRGLAHRALLLENRRLERERLEERVEEQTREICPVDREFVRAFIGIARALDVETIAEQVEDGETVKLQAEYGVEYAQGYHLGGPEEFPLEPPHGA